MNKKYDFLPLSCVARVSPAVARGAAWSRSRPPFRSSRGVQIVFLLLPSYFVFWREHTILGTRIHTSEYDFAPTMHNLFFLFIVVE